MVNMKKFLTLKQKKILDSIKDYMNNYEIAPSIEELCEITGLSSSSSIHYHLKILEEKGYIKREAGRSRSMIIIEKENFNNFDEEMIDIPIIGEIAAGEPIYAYENYSDSIKLARSLISSDEAFILKVKGKSMIEDLIDDGDMVVVKKQNSANNGDIVVALLPDDGATLKRFYKEKDRIRLQPANSTMQPIYTTDLKIQGKVIALLRVHEQRALSFS